MRRFALVILVLFLIFVVTLAIVAGLALVVMPSKPDVGKAVILELNLQQPFPEHSPPSALNPFAQEVTTLRDVVDTLRRAAEDDKVKGMIATIGAGSVGMAQAQEIRNAVEIFRASGKPAIAFAETFGEVGPGNVGYYMASAFDEIWLQPSGDIGLTGFMLESQFLAGTIEKIDAEAQFDQRYEFKNAMNQFTSRDFTEAHEEAMQRLAESWMEQLSGGIASGRGLSDEQVRALIDRGPYLGDEALEAGLVDHMGYRDEAYDAIEERVGSEAELLYANVYLEGAGRPDTSGPKVALIYGVGQVVRGESVANPLFGSLMGSDTVTSAIRAAVREEVSAIVLRVDSPGGSYVASDAIWREVVRAREAGIPVVVSMGGLAASGGYFVAMPADRIVALPGTITGSIGVLGGKFILRETWNNLGVTFDSVQAGENADMYSTLEPYDEYAWSRHQDWLDRVYEDFTEKVAAGRDLTLERVQEIAKGRIWTGADAQGIGLVDALGGYTQTWEQVRELLDLDPDASINVQLFPRPKTFFEQLMQQQQARNSREEVGTYALMMPLDGLEPLLELGRKSGVIGPAPGVLSAPVEPKAR